MSKNPCHGCFERTTGCHVVCSIGIAQDAVMEKRREEIKKYLQSQKDLALHAHDNQERIRRKAHRMPV